MANWGQTAFLLGAAAGAAAVVLIQKQSAESASIPPEKVLEKVKATFKQQGPVDGSWIQMKPEQIDNFGFPVLVYNGGISRPGANGNEQFEFSADAKTGTILRVEAV